MPYLTDDLLTAVKRRGNIPSNQPSFTDPDLLAIGDEEIQSQVAPLILSLHEEYYVTTYDQTLTSGLLSYRIPYRAVGLRLREVSLLHSDGTEHRLSRVSPSDIENVAQGFYLQNNSVVLVSDPKTTVDQLRMRFLMRPNRMVLSANCAKVQSVAGNVVTATGALPAAFLSSSTYDLIRGVPGFDTYDWDRTVSGVGASSLTLSTAPPIALGANDYVALSEQTPIPQIPPELVPLLTARIVLRVFEAQGDDAGIAQIGAEMARLEAAAGTLLANRVDASPQKIVNRDSLFRQSPPTMLGYRQS